MISLEGGIHKRRLILFSRNVAWDLAPAFQPQLIIEDLSGKNLCPFFQRLLIAPIFHLFIFSSGAVRREELEKRTKRDFSSAFQPKSPLTVFLYSLKGFS
jgi:hypothetical protein